MSNTEDPMVKLEEQITCPICLGHFKEPKVLHCHHAYCKKCLDKLLNQARQTMADPVFDCPQCHKHTPVPLDGAAGLDSAFQTIQIMELREALKRAQGPLIRQMSSVDEEEESLEASAISLKKSANMCPRHEASERTLYCECGEAICFQCLKDHVGHKYDLLSEVSDKHKEELKGVLDPLENKALRLEKDLLLLKARSTEVSVQQNAIQEEIVTLIDGIHSILNARKEFLINQLDQVTVKKLKQLNTEMDFRETVHAQLSGTTRHIKEVLNSKNEMEMVEMKAKLIERAEKASKAFGGLPDLMNIDVEADVAFSSPPNITSNCASLGQILTSSLPDPNHCICNGEGLQRARVDETMIITMQISNYKGKPIKETIPSLKCKLTFEGVPTSCKVEKKERNLYQISYMATNRGKHELHITIDGEHVKKSPFSIDARVPVQRLGKPLKTINARVAWGSVINNAGELIVTECNYDKIQIYNLDGEKLSTFGLGRGPGKMQFHHPCGVTVDDEDDIYVAEGSNFRIQKFSRSGEHIGFVGKQGTKDQDFSQPKCIAFNPVNRRIYMADLTNVKVFNKDLTLYAIIGSKGNGPGRFGRVFGVTCTPNGNVYVSDVNNKQIQIFTADGNFLHWFPNQILRVPNQNPFSYKEIAPPRAIFATGEHLYVSNDQQYSVSVFTLDGKILHTFGCNGSDSGQFHEPFQVAVSETGMVFVNDYKNNRVQVF